MSTLDDEVITQIRRNIFHGAHGAIKDWSRFPWHRDQKNQPDTFKSHASQALAIDVFGTLQAHRGRNELVGALLRVAFPGHVFQSRTWDVRLEENVRVLAEPRPTQLDAILEGEAELVTIESKFCESGAGPCSQTDAISKGPNKGKRQCNGRYETQVNPVSGDEARCALTAKGVEYWKWIPDLFGMDPDADHDGDCFFRDGKFQLMRNVVAAEAMAQEAKPPKVGMTLLVFMGGNSFPVAAEVADPESPWNQILLRLRPRKRSLVASLSYQAVIHGMTTAFPDDQVVRELHSWVLQKKLPAGIAATSRGHGRNA